jgi:type IV pilus assembly protein PilB
MKIAGTVGIEDILFEDKLLSSDQLSLVKLEHINTGKAVEEILVDHGFVDETNLTKAKAQLVGVPFIPLSGKGISPEVLNFVPEPVARRYKLVPFDYDKANNSLSVAMVDPLDLQVLEFIEQKSGATVKPFIAVPSEIDTAISEQYAQSLSTEVSAALKEAPPEIGAKIDEKKIGEIIREAPVAKIVSTLLEYAMKARASDIHIEPAEDKTRVRYRIDGILHEKLALPRKVHDAVISRVKILSDMKIDEKRLPQDGRFNFKSGNEEVDLRVSTLPTVHGEKVVMRLLKKSGGVPTMPELGLRGTALKNLEIAMLRPHGIIIVCGPTGSGKTTTLYAVLSKINSIKVNIVTLEDPVEYQMPGVNQVQINPQAGLTFASGLRAFLRQDPNIIMVGEIRDGETAQLAIQASLTGHLVFSTLHTNNSAGALPRLLDMGAEPFLLASSMNAVVAQRVVRKICPSCKTSYDPPSEVISDLKSVLGKLYPDQKGGSVKLYRGQGCSECNQTGYSGRVGIFEVLPVSEKVGRLVLERASASDVETAAAEEGMISMKQDGYIKAIEGVTSIEEVLRVAQD